MRDTEAEKRSLPKHLLPCPTPGPKPSVAHNSDGRVTTTWESYAWDARVSTEVIDTMILGPGLIALETVATNNGSTSHHIARGARQLKVTAATRAPAVPRG